MMRRWAQTVQEKSRSSIAHVDVQLIKWSKQRRKRKQRRGRRIMRSGRSGKCTDEGKDTGSKGGGDFTWVRFRAEKPFSAWAQQTNTCDMNMEEADVYMSALCSKLAPRSVLKAENDSAGSKVQAAPTTAKCVMRWEREEHTHTLWQEKKKLLLLTSASVHNSQREHRGCK